MPNNCFLVFNSGTCKRCFIHTFNGGMVILHISDGIYIGYKENLEKKFDKIWLLNVN